jgi:hypothetical protein
MPSIIDLINASMPTVSRSVDLTLSSLSSNGALIVDGNPDPALDLFFPLVSYQDDVLAMLKFRTYKPTLGYVVATDGEIPVDRERVTITQELFGNFKLAKSRLITEEDMNVARRAEMLAASGSLLAAEKIRDTFLAIPSQLTQGVINLHTKLSLDTACLGACNFLDPTTNITANLSYTSQIPAGNLAAALTGTARWSQLTTATGVQDLVDHMNAVYANIRRFPPYVVMSRFDANNLRNQASTKELVARSKGIITEVGTPAAAAISALEPPTMAEISNIIGARLMAGGGQPGTTTLIVSDALYYIRGAGILGTQTFTYIPPNYYFFAWEGYIERAIVPTASNNYAGGLVTSTEILKKEPPQESVTVAGRGFPLAADPRLIASRNVENNAIILS